jgi:hypothetical protein
MHMGLQDQHHNGWIDQQIQTSLVAKGFQQVHGIDYDETFTPVEKMDSIPLAPSIAETKGWEVHQMDVKNSFLHIDLSKEINMEQP